MALTRVKGSSWDTSDNLVADIIANLIDIEHEGIIFVSGALRINDGNGGWFKYDPDVLRSDADGHDIIDPTGTSAGRGCWIRQRYKTDGPGLNVSEVQAAAADQQDFRLQRIVYAPGSGSLAIYVNGTRLTPFSFNETSSTTVNIASPLRAGDIVEFLHFEQPTGGGHLNIQAQQVQFEPLGSSIVSTNVQGAIQELDAMIGSGGGGGGGGGFSGTALSVPYLAVAPDISNNVQDGMHWIQKQALDHVHDLNAAHVANSIAFNPGLSGLHAITVQAAIDELVTGGGLDAGTAAGTSFDNSIIIGAPNNVQLALEDIYTKSDGIYGELTEHLQDPLAAHLAASIAFISVEPLFTDNTVTEIETALNLLASQMATQNLDADRVLYNQAVTGLGGDVQEAITTLYQQNQAHAQAVMAAHNALAIQFTAVGSLASNNVAGALAELDTNLTAHKASPIAHTAKKISFNPASSMMISTNVEDAILEASVNTNVFKGHLDITQAYSPLVPAPLANDYYLASVDGTADASWQLYFANTFPDPIKQGDALIFDGSKFWYTPLQQNLSAAIIAAPAPGQSQTIQTAGVNDSALILSGVTNQVAPVLELIGNATIHGSILDDLGSVRQAAVDVAYNNGASNLLAVNVKAALDELDNYRALHITGLMPATQHSANTIKFQPIVGVNALDVQAAIRTVQQNLGNHESIAGMHIAQRIMFDNTGSVLSGSTVQEALLELASGTGSHASDPLNAHAATAIYYNGINSGSAAVNVQTAIDESLLNTSFDIIDGGLF